MKQSTANLVMIEPTHFFSNPETLADNKFQNTPDKPDAHVHSQAQQEFTTLVKNLKNSSVEISLYKDKEGENSPDSIFPNNWFSTHAPDLCVLYPMKSPLRRKERRQDIITNLRKSYPCLLDLTNHECSEIFLEGTGSIIIDHINRQAYCAISQRSDQQLFTRWCELMNFQGHSFASKDKNGSPIYHTNVMMAIGTEWVVICLEALPDQEERERIKESLASHQKTIIEISLEQVEQFCGNILEVRSSRGQLHVALSEQAWNGFTAEQRQILERSTKPIVTDVSTIEKVGGGGVRCMLAELF